jgi:signal transduction histidine kinase
MAATAVVAMALLAGSVVLVRTLDHSLATAADQRATARLAELVDQARHGTLPEVVDGIGDDSLAQVVDGRGHVVAASANISGRPAIAVPRETPENPEPRTMRGLPDDNETEDYRIWSARTDTPDGVVAVLVGPSLEASQEAGHELVTSLLVGLPLLVALLALAIWVIVGRALRPVENVRREVAGLDARSLGARVQVPPTHDEVARLAVTMNELLARLESAERRQREFVGNASHDLQSPLGVFRTELEVALATADLKEWQRTGRHLLDENAHMESLVGDLLFLARAEEGLPVAGTALDLEDLVAEEVARTATGQIRVDLRSDPVPVHGNREQLSRMVRNLLLNAVEFAEERVAVDLREEEGTAVLVVSDDGPGVPEHHRAEVFDRFFTRDQARDRRTGGTGLGLSIARSVAETHGGTLDLAGTGPTSLFVVRLPVL